MVKYQIYYWDNDRQKRIIATDLTYFGAVNFTIKNSLNYHTDVLYEPQPKQ